MLFTFPSRYWFTIGLPRVFSLGGRARQIHTGFHVPRATQVYATIIIIIHKGLSPAMARLSKLFCIMIITDHAYPTTPQRPKPPWFGLIPVRSPLLGESLLFSLPPGTKMFQFPGLASVSKRMTYLQYAGFSHSDTPWSMAVCASHGIFAAYRVLRRLREPRHPPYALVHFCLTIACVLHDEGNMLRIQGRCCSGLTAQDQKQMLDRLLLTLKSVVVAFNVSVCPLSH